MHPGNVKFGARMEQFGARIVPAEGAFGYVIFRRPKEQARRLNVHDSRKSKTTFSWAGSVPIFEGCFPL